MFSVDYQSNDELTEGEKLTSSDNGSGQEYATYIRVTHDNKTILLVNDAMEPEDATFNRDLSWIKDIIEKAYVLGRADAINNS